jgi:DNA polymerase III alpha subunit (gram-positive type)
MEIVILDTEYTSWEGSMKRNWNGPNEHREIVQIAAIKVDSYKLNELQEFSVLIQPKINSTLSNYFTMLTGIENDMLIIGKTFGEGISLYKNFVGECTVFACGNEGDIIKENLEIIGSGQDFKALIKVRNLRPWFCSNGVDAEAISSGNLHKYLEIEVEGHAHNALHDVRSILVSIKHLVSNGASNPFLGFK